MADNSPAWADKSPAAEELYEAMVRYVVSHGARRQERVSGWWWGEKLEDEATLGDAVEQLLHLDGIDTRVMLTEEPEEFWDDWR